jgi:hypothetical protein
MYAHLLLNVRYGHSQRLRLQATLERTDDSVVELAKHQMSVHKKVSDL